MINHILSFIIFSIPKNSSYVSIQDYESSQSSPYNTWSRLPPLVHNKQPGGRAEFLGLCLPIDVTMVFEVQVNSGIIDLLLGTVVVFTDASIITVLYLEQKIL